MNKLKSPNDERKPIIHKTHNLLTLSICSAAKPDDYYSNNWEKVNCKICWALLANTFEGLEPETD